MKPFAKAGDLLNNLLTRFEMQTERSKRIIAPAQMSFPDPDARDRLVGGLRAAEAAGAVELVLDRDAPHLVAKVILRDAEALYRHLGRTPIDVSIAAALSDLEGVEAGTPEAMALKSAFLEEWPRGVRVASCGFDRPDVARGLVRAMDAAFTRLEPGLPLRTRSARLLGDSKALERVLTRLLKFARERGLVEDLADEPLRKRLGLEKFPQPVLVAGAATIGGVDIGAWTYAGLPPEASATLAIASGARSLLTVENLESFNRHIREARQPGDVIVYIGGFPSSAVVAALNVAISRSGLPEVSHWGDVDAGGVRIGAFLERAIAADIRPHLMTKELAINHGEKIGPMRGLALPAGSAFADLAEFLSSDDAHSLEQEALDPRPVIPFSRGG